MKENYYQVELNKTAWEVPTRYKDLVPVGSGAYGQVCSASDIEMTHETPKVAIKKLARPFQSAIHAKRTYREMRMLKHMKHDNIIGLLDVFTPSTSLEDFNDVYLVTPLMGADLNNIVKTQKLSDDHVQFLVYQILRGMKYVHSAGIIHRVKHASFFEYYLIFKSLIPGFKTFQYRRQRGLWTADSGFRFGQTDGKWNDGLCGHPLVQSTWNYAQLDALSSNGWHVVSWMHYGWNVDWSHLISRDWPWVLLNLLKHVSCDLFADIDQLTRILVLCGTPTEDTLNKITSDEARNYIRSLPHMERKNFSEFFKGANPLGKQSAMSS